MGFSARQDLINEMLINLERPRKPLTEWEQNFFESVWHQFQENGELSEAQFEKLQQIEHEKGAM